MASTYLKDQSARRTPQSEPIPSSTQVPNSAGGHSFQIDDWGRLERFLILGSEGGSYYASQHDLTKANVGALRRCLAADGARTVETIKAVSIAGRAPRNTEAIFALALASAAEDKTTARLALDAIPQVCRTGTHLFEFVEFVESFRGWGRSLRRGIAGWYADKATDALAYQLVKYRQRGGWSHRDLLRLAHIGTSVSSGNPEYMLTPEHEGVLAWAAGKPDTEWLAPLPEAIEAFIAAQEAATAKDAVKLIEKYGSALPREAIKPEHLGTPEVWGALLDAGMPMTALIRNLATLTRVGVLKPLDARVKTVTEQITDAERLRKARVHPFAILLALSTYNTGHSMRGSGTWDPISQVTDALDAAFYMAFENVEPTNKRFLLGLDVSGSMGSHMRDTFLSCRDGAAAMAMVTARTEQAHHAVAFTSGNSRDAFKGNGGAVEPFSLSPRQRLDDVVRAMNGLPFGGTDCALPMLYAADRGLDVDVFVVYTDSETWAGEIHPVQALQAYREKTGIAAKLVVVGMVGNEFSIADPDDAGMLDVVGFDSSAPAVLADFARG